MTEFGFNLHKQVFRDALCLHYEWSVNCIPSHCVCGMPFSIDHAFSCPKGVFPITRLNRIRVLLAELPTEVCPCVAVEPALQPLSGESFQRTSFHQHRGQCKTGCLCKRILGQKQSNCFLWCEGVQCPCSLEWLSLDYPMLS